MKEITNILISEIEYYSGLMFSKKELAIILELSETEFIDMISDPDSLAAKAFSRGRLKKEAEIRKSIFDLAQNGSSPAQSFAVKLIENAKMDDL